MALTKIVEVYILCNVSEALDKVTLKKGDKCTDWVIKVLYVVTLIETQQKVKQSSWWTDCGRVTCEVSYTVTLTQGRQQGETILQVCRETATVVTDRNTPNWRSFS